MTPDEYGEIVQKCWQELKTHFGCIKLDKFVVMPNHVQCNCTTELAGPETYDGVQLDYNARMIGYLKSKGKKVMLLSGRNWGFLQVCFF